MAVTATVAAVVATVGSAAVGGYQAKRSADRADQASDRAAREKAELAAREKSEREMAARKMVLDRRRALAMSQQGRGGTIRTTPLGIPRTPGVGGNTILGAA